MKNVKSKIGFLCIFIFIMSFSISFCLAETTSNVTKADAIYALEQSQQIINQMEKDELSIILVNDTLNDAKNIFQQAVYAEVLRNPSASEAEVTGAADALKLVNWKDITYASVLIFTNKMKEFSSQAYMISDKISVIEKDLVKYSSSSNINLSEVDIVFSQAITAFKEDRYDEANVLLDKTSQSLENAAQSSTLLASMGENAKNFFQRYKYYIAAVLAILLFLIYSFSKRMSLNRLKKKINHYKIEQKAVGNLIRDTQNERFKKNKISGLVYNIRMKKYKERLADIEETLPVLEKRLKRKNK